MNLTGFVVATWIAAVLAQECPPMGFLTCTHYGTTSCIPHSEYFKDHTFESTTTKTWDLGAREFQTKMECYKSMLSWGDGFETVEVKPERIITTTRTISVPMPVTAGRPAKWATRRWLDDGTTYRDSEGFVRFKFLSPSSLRRWQYTIDTFTAILPVKETTTSVITTTFLDYNTYSKSLGCDREVGHEFCNYIWSSFYSKRNAATSIPLSLMDDPDLPRSLCRSLPRKRQCELIMREEIILFFWPPEHSTSGTTITKSLPNNEEAALLPKTFMTDAITFQGEDFWEIPAVLDSDNPFTPVITTSVLSGKFTFTSPTAYIAHHRVGVRRVRYSRACEEVKITAGIMPIATTDIYTKYLSNVDALQLAKSVAKGKSFWITTRKEETLRHIDFLDLQDPVPATAYYTHHSECWNAQNACATITDGSFRPQIFLHDRVWFSLFGNLSEAVTCTRPALWDPPIEISTIEEVPRAAQFPADRVANLDRRALAGDLTADDSIYRMSTSVGPMPVATKSAYHISATQGSFVTMTRGSF